MTNYDSCGLNDKQLRDIERLEILRANPRPSHSFSAHFGGVQNSKMTGDDCHLFVVLCERLPR